MLPRVAKKNQRFMLNPADLQENFGDDGARRITCMAPKTNWNTMKKEQERLDSVEWVDEARVECEEYEVALMDSVSNS